MPTSTLAPVLPANAQEHRQERRARTPRDARDEPEMGPRCTDSQLAALRAVAQRGSAAASTALHTVLGHPIEVTVPAPRTLASNDATRSLGDPESAATGVVVGVFGDLHATAALRVTPGHAGELCRLLGSPTHSNYHASVLSAIADIVASAYVGAVADMTSTALKTTPPRPTGDTLAAVVNSIAAGHTAADEPLVLLDSTLRLENRLCSVSFLLVCGRAGSDLLQERLNPSSARHGG